MPETAERAHLLFVDDEEGIRVTLGALLRKHGFDVTTVATVRDALTQINGMHYDALLCDMNIEKPGDGFVVISAMRYAQPHCISLVLTAYPSFENAMEAIRHQVDEFFTKPADVDALVRKMKEKLNTSKSKVRGSFKRLSVVLRENCANIIAKVGDKIKGDSVLSAADFSRAREDNLQKMMDALIEHVEAGRNGLTSEVLRLGVEHGRRRQKQGCDARMVVREFQLIDEQVCELMVSDRMPAAPVGLTADLMKLTKGLNALTMEALKPFAALRPSSTALSRRSQTWH